MKMVRVDEAKEMVVDDEKARQWKFSPHPQTKADGMRMKDGE